MLAQLVIAMHFKDGDRTFVELSNLTLICRIDTDHDATLFTGIAIHVASALNNMMQSQLDTENRPIMVPLHIHGPSLYEQSRSPTNHVDYNLL